MHRSALRQASLCSLLVSATLALSAAAQGRAKQRPVAPPASGAAVSVGADSLNNVKFRNLGPSVGGGRVAAVVGVPGDRNTYYVGAAAGGVWKTTDGGDSWEAVFKDQPTASIGALALAPSNPNVVWVGTGEGNPRNDVVDGRGVFMSPDAGKSWQFMGLGDVGQISRIVIDPADPDVVFVAALGHVWAPNAERGVFRTADGGKTWHKVLFVNDTTGVSDLVMVPGNPRLLFAAMWQFVRHPWELVSGGAASGIYRSKDGGLTWERLKDGLPTGLLGRIAVAVGPTNPSHVYALIETTQGMLWDSKDQGDHWSKVSDFHGLSARPFYFSLLHVSPVDDRKLFFSSYLLLRSDDGGKTTTPIDRGVHVDHHALWIDPQNPDRMIQGNDGGAYVTESGAKNWRYLNNLPIEQFYMVAADNNAPYMLCGGLQDNNAWCGPSSGTAGGGGSGGSGGLNGSEWFTVTGGDGEYAVPAPSDSSILYVDSQNGNITRVDLKTGLTRSIRPYLSTVNEMKPANLKYRFNWTSPITVSARDANTAYIGANVVFKTTDGGERWTALSPDLTRNDKAKQVTSGGPIEYDISGAETYNTTAARRGATCRAASQGSPKMRKGESIRSASHRSTRAPRTSPWIATSSTTGVRTCTRRPTTARPGPTSARVCRRTSPCTWCARIPTCAASSCWVATPPCGIRATVAAAGSPSRPTSPPRRCTTCSSSSARTTWSWPRTVAGSSCSTISRRWRS